MDPIAAFRAQQQRNGDASAKKEKTILELRLENPTVALLFDGLDKSADGGVNFDSACKGLMSSVGNVVQAPSSQRVCQKIFRDIDKDAKGHLNLRQFFDFMQQGSAKLQPDDGSKENQQHKDVREKLKKPEEVDIFTVLGIKKTKEMTQVEERKKKALETNSVNRQRRLSSLSLLGDAIIGKNSQNTVENANGEESLTAATAAPMTLAAVRKFAGFKRTVTLESAGSAEPEDDDEPVSPTKKLRDAWDRFSVSASSETSSRSLTNAKQIHLSEYLPQVRALGKRNAGCVYLTFSNDGSQVAGGFFDGGVRVYDVDDAKQIHCMNLPRNKGGSVGTERESYGLDRHSSRDGEEPDFSDVNFKYLSKDWEPVTSVSWRPATGNHLAGVDTKGVIHLWQIPRNTQQGAAKLLGQTSTGGGLSSVTFTCDGSSIVTAGNDKVIKTFDVSVEFGKATFNEGASLGNDLCIGNKLTGHSLKITSVRAHPKNPSILVSAGLDRSIFVWDLRARSGTAVGGVQGPELSGDAVDICKDGVSLLTGSHRRSNAIEIYDLRMCAEAKPVTSYAWRGNEPTSEGGGRYTTCQLFSVGWNQFDNSTIVAGGENENLARVYERPSNPEDPLLVVGTLRGKDHSFWSSAVTADGRKVAFGSSDGAVCLMDVTRKH